MERDGDRMHQKQAQNARDVDQNDPPIHDRPPKTTYGAPPRERLEIVLDKPLRRRFPWRRCGA